MAIDKNLEIYTGLFIILAILLLGLDIVVIGNVPLQNMGIIFFKPVANIVAKKSFYADQTFYLVRLFILFCAIFSAYGSKPRKKLKENSNLLTYVIISALSGVFFTFSYFVFKQGQSKNIFILFILVSVISFMFFVFSTNALFKIINSTLGKDRFGKEGRKFNQTKDKMENEDSVNLKTDDGWINVVNPFRAVLVIGTPGSGKTFAILLQAILQHIKKGFSMCVYDYKFPTLTIFTYNVMKKFYGLWKIKPEFCVINFDDPTKSHRCNPLQPELLVDPLDAVESAKALMIALNRSWNAKQGDFFVESPINYVACLIWALKCAEDGKYCSLPHLIELLSKDYETQFEFLISIKDNTIANMAAPFISAYEKDATDQLEGQIASARLGLSRMTSPVVYWVSTTEKDPVTGKEIDGIDLQINDPKRPKILCVGNNPDRQEVYSAVISLFMTRMMKMINKKGMHKLALVFDELTTMSFPKGTLDNIIATGRSNKIATWLGFQDLTQAIRDFSKENAEAVVNTIGNIFSGQVSGDTAQKLARMFGKIKVRKESQSVSDSGTSISYSEQQEDLIPESDISTLSQGVFVGRVSDNFGEEIEQKFFYSKIHVDIDEITTLEKGELPTLTYFYNSKNEIMTAAEIKEVLNQNFLQIREDVTELTKRMIYQEFGR